MAKKKAKKKAPTGGRPENWQEICMARVPTKESEPPKPETKKKEEPAEKEA